MLDTATRNIIFGAIQRWWSNVREQVAFNKADLAAAVDATDDWIEANSSSFNSSLPVNFRTSATLVQKTLLFCYVALKRANLNVSGE